MTDAVYCDHCGKLNKREFIVQGTMKGFNLFPEETTFDLCDKCKSSLDKWVSRE